MSQAMSDHLEINLVPTQDSITETVSSVETTESISSVETTESTESKSKSVGHVSKTQSVTPEDSNASDVANADPSPQRADVGAGLRHKAQGHAGEKDGQARHCDTNWRWYKTDVQGRTEGERCVQS